jgi:golgi phosphoprotein 3
MEFDMLMVYEQLYLLALNEEKGNFLPFTKKAIPYGLAGAILADLALLGVVCINEKGRLELAEAAPPTTDAILSEVVQEIQKTEKLRKLPYWITQLNDRPKKLRVRLGERMAEKQLVIQDEDRFYWPEQSAAPALNGLPHSKFELKYPLRSAIFTDIKPEPGSLALLHIAGHCGLLDLIFTEDELPIARRILQEKVMEGAMENPALQTVEEIGYTISAVIDDDSD